MSKEREKDFEDLSPEEMQPMFLGGKGNFLNEVREKEKAKFVPKIQNIADIEEDNLKSVFDAYSDLNINIGKLDSKIAEIIRRQQNDFISAYKIEMELIQGELKEMKRKYQEFMKRAGLNSQIEKLEGEIQFFIQETKKLKAENDDKDAKISNLKGKISILEGERKFLTEYIMIHVRKNKLINIDRVSPLPNDKSPSRSRLDISPFAKSNTASEIARTPIRGKSFQKDSEIFSVTKIPEGELEVDHGAFESKLKRLDSFLNEINQKDWDDKLQILSDVEGFYKDMVITYETKIRDIKEQFAREKIKIRGEVSNRISSKNQLEEFFEECVEKVRSTISRRKFISKQTNGNFDKKTNRDEYVDPRISTSEFLQTDKHRVLELFISNETICKVLKYLIFWNDKKEAKSESTSNSKQKVDPDVSFLANVLGDNAVNNLNDLSYSKGPSQSQECTPMKLPPLVESKNEPSSIGKTNEIENRSRKFAMIFESPNIPKYEPKARSAMREVKKNYNHYNL